MRFLFCLLVLFQVMATPVFAQVLPSRAAAQAMAPNQLGRLLLGPERGDRVTSFALGVWPHRSVTSLVLSELAEQVGDDLCARMDHHVSLTHVDPSAAALFNVDTPTRVSRISSRRSFALRSREDCARQSTYTVSNNMSEEQIMAVLRRLADARSQAAGAAPLRFVLTCSDDRRASASDICAAGGRTALASLPIEQISSINPGYNRSCVRTVFEYPGDRCPAGVNDAPRQIEFWEIQMAMAAGEGMTWIVGLAGETTTSAIEIQRTQVIYH